MDNNPYEDGEGSGVWWHGIQDEDEDCKTQAERLSKLATHNNVGVFCYKADKLTELMRFLILGNEGGTYHHGEPVLQNEQISCIHRLIITRKGPEVVALIKDVSTKGRACKQKPILYALAQCARSNDPDTKRAAYDILPDVCRIPTQLFQFIEFCEEWSAGTGWGRAHKKALSKWYHSFSGKDLKLARLVTKFRKRFSWNHKDIIRLAHIKPKNHEVGVVLRYLTQGLEDATKMYCTAIGQIEPDPGVVKIGEFLKVVEETKTCTNPKKIIPYISRYRLVREHMPTDLLQSTDVWQALLWNMPIEAMIRNLGKMTAIGLLNPGTENETLVISRLQNKEMLQRSRLHPYRALVAYNQYRKGQGERGKLKWTPSENINKAFDTAFHLCYGNITPTGKRMQLAVDVSGSMNVPVAGNSSITARDAAAAMMMATVRSEENPEIYAFANDFTQIEVTKNDPLNLVIRKFSNLYYSEVDCARPITYAIENKKLVDVFIIYTDSHTNYGHIHPVDALQKYRSFSGIQDAKLIIVGMSSSCFAIADRTDPFMLDVVGFDSAAPQAIDLFIRGKIL